MARFDDGPTPEHSKSLTHSMTIQLQIGATSRRRLLTGAALLLVLASLAWLALSRGTKTDGDGDDVKPAPHAAKPDRDNDVVLDTSEAVRAELATTVLVAARDAASGGAQPGVGLRQVQGELVADPTRLTTIRAAVPGRLVSTRWPALGQAVGAGEVIGQVSDAKALVSPRAGTVTRLGAQPGELVQAGQELLQLTDFGASLARIVWRSELGAAPSSLTLAPANGATAGVTARLVGIGAEVDSVTRSPVYMYRFVGGWPSARPGLPVVATVRDRGPGAGAVVTSGAQTLFVPNDAIVQWNALAWVYVEREPRHYRRVRVLTDRPTSGGYLMPVGALKPGDRVVTRGAQQLLSQEFGAQSPGTDEDGK